MLQLKFASNQSNNNNGAAQFMEAELPLSIEQPDKLREGLTGGAVRSTLAVEPSFNDKRAEMLRNVASQYGLGAAIRRQADLKVVEQFHRLPGLKSSFLGLEIELGEDSDLKPEDWLGDVHDSARLQCDLHATMQKHLGMIE